MKLGYNTNGLSFHPLDQALELIAENGYHAVGLTLDYHCLNPYEANLSAELERVRRSLETFGLAVVVETGARFLLNPKVKHDPTLLSGSKEGRARRQDFLKRATDIAVALNAEAVSFWSGSLEDEIGEEAALERLAEGCRELSDYAGERGVKLAFEPEPGMFIDTFDRFAELREKVRGENFGLTVDVGHVHCLEPRPIAEYLREWRDLIWNIHIEDMNKGVHEHLRFGEGEIDFAPVMQSLGEIGYEGCVNVELSRQAHMAPEMLRESMAFLKPLVG